MVQTSSKEFKMNAVECTSTLTPGYSNIYPVYLESTGGSASCQGLSVSQNISEVKFLLQMLIIPRHAHLCMCVPCWLLETLRFAAWMLGNKYKVCQVPGPQPRTWRRTGRSVVECTGHGLLVCWRKRGFLRKAIGGGLLSSSLCVARAVVMFVP